MCIKCHVSRNKQACTFLPLPIQKRLDNTVAQMRKNVDIVSQILLFAKTIKLRDPVIHACAVNRWCVCSLWDMF